jgi:hypothetical protein
MWMKEAGFGKEVLKGKWFGVVHHSTWNVK